MACHGAADAPPRRTVERTATTSSALTSFVQANYANVATATVTFSAAQVAGDLNLVIVGGASPDMVASVLSVADTAGNAYALAGTQPQEADENDSWTVWEVIYYAKNIAASPSNTVTVTLDDTASLDIRVAEYSGLDRTNPLDAVGTHVGQSASLTASVTTTNASDLIVATGCFEETVTGPGPGFTSRMSTPFGDIVEDRTVSSVGTYTATPVVPADGGYVEQLIALRTAAGSTPAFVQGNYYDDDAIFTSELAAVTLPLRSAQAAGDLNFVAVAWDSTPAVALTAVTDSAGNTYSLAAGPTQLKDKFGSFTLQQSIYYAKNIVAAASNAITVTFAQPVDWPDVRAVEYGGLDPTNPVDVTGVLTGKSNATSTGPVTTTNANDLLVAAIGAEQGITGAGPGFTNRVLAHYGDIIEDKTVSAIGTYTATAPATLGAWIGQIVAFRAAGSGGPSCAGVTCTASDACHVAGTCNPSTGLCSNPVAANGTSCSDGNACTLGDTCQAGTCTAGSAVTCTASDACHTAGTCSPSAGTCSNPVAANGTACSDGNACTLGDSCQAGTCTGGSPATCAASDQCHAAGSCNPGTGACSNPALANGTGCNDGNACTLGDSCQGGTCTGGSPVSCAASDQCHAAGSCDPGTGACSNPALANGTGCSDGNACTLGDSCQAGTCTAASPVSCAASDQCHAAGSCDPGTGACSNPARANGTGCNDGNACTGGDTCQAGTCTGGSTITCTASDSCHTAGTCNPATGACSNPAASDGTACTGTNKCEQTYACASGTCTGSNPVTCAASDACHVAGTCDPASGACSNPTATNGTVCNDGNACTQSDTCQGGACTGSNPVACVASSPCHVAGTCDPTSGGCSNPPAPNGTPCTDGNACTQTDACNSGACIGSNPVTCTATGSTCDPTSGTCSTPPPPDGGTGGSVVAGGSGDPAISGTTTETLSLCPGASGLTYDGKGSGNSSQSVAPSAAFLGGEVCLLPPAAQTTAAGLVIGLDAIALVGDLATAGSATCNGVDVTDCSPEAAGIAYDITVNRPVHGPYTFNSWRDVLRVLYAGVTNDPSDQGCDSEIRQTIANNWGNLFETQCSGGNCTKLQHLLRPDDGSAEAQAFAAILGLPTRSSASALNGFGTSPYCNSLNWDGSPANASCGLGAHRQWVGPGGILDSTAADGTHHGPPPGTWGSTPDPTQGALGADVLPTSYQDNDPIRRPCIGSAIAGNTGPAEEVCNLDGALGLVLSVPSVDFVSVQNAGRNPFPTAPCTGFAAGPPEPIFTCAATGVTHGACPDGAAMVQGTCQIPVDSSGNSLCENEPSHWPSSTDPVAKDGRIFNSVLFSGATGYTQSHVADPAGGPSFTFPFAGHWGRIHSQTVVWDPGNIATQGVPCQQQNATSQIGCLAQADPCGLGFAATAALSWNGFALTNTVPIKLNEELPLPECIQDLTYPLWHKLYLNSVSGFPGLSGPDLALAQCEADPDIIDTALVDNQLIPLGLSDPNGSNPYCEDFDEQVTCGQSSNVDGCAGNGFVGLPTASTTCGNGVLEAYEECDNGNANLNGGAPGTCSLICRFN